MRLFLTFIAGLLAGSGVTAWLSISGALPSGRGVAAASEAKAVRQVLAPPPLSEAKSVLDPPISDEQRLMERQLALPIVSYPRKDIYDSFYDRRGGTRIHEGIDLHAPRGTPVVAVDAGSIIKLFTSKPGGLTIYQFDREQVYCYYYAHLDRYAEGLHEGQEVERGELLAYVGHTGNASPDAPHLHLSIFKLGPDKNWWQGTPVNPYPILINAAR